LMGDVLSVTIASLSRWISSRRDLGRGPFNGGKCAEQVQCTIYVWWALGGDGRFSCEQNATVRRMAVYQQGWLALLKIRQNGQQRIMVQYVNVSNGRHTVMANVERDHVDGLEKPLNTKGS
jgi:hypothetical protein